MGNTKYSTLLTVLLVIAILAIIGLLIFVGVDVYRKYYFKKDAIQAAEQFNNQFTNNIDSNNTIIDEMTIVQPPIENEIAANEVATDEVVDPFANLISEDTNSSSSGTRTNKQTYKGYVVEGTIQIPRTNLNCPILENATKGAIEVAVGIQVGPGLNQVGNTVIAGHNYRNGLFFANNKNIQIGDKIYIKDSTGFTVTYIAYDKFETTVEDASYINRDTAGKREITLYTCNDDASKRLVILAKEQ